MNLFPVKREQNNLIGLPQDRLRQFFAESGAEPYRAHQVFTWVYHNGVRDFDRMTNLSKTLRTHLKEHFHITPPRIQNKTTSQDGSVKYLFQLEDGQSIESVWMPAGPRKTLCISTQVGCRLACAFCMTGSLGLKRNLSAAEILGQCMAVNEDLNEKDQVTNVVLMGMGEPLDNYDATVDAVRLMISPEGLRISARKVTLSTAGQVDLIKKFQEENLHVNLAISLNATDDKTRGDIMPINKKYPIKDLMECLRNYPLKPTRRLTFEYVLLGGINDRDEDAQRLAKLLHGIPSKINLIPFNWFSPSEFRPPSEERVHSFQDYLLSKNYSVFIRQNRATDILGACGQLAAQSFTTAPACG
ncbi:50S rRNA methyltransferase [Candidatus Nitromaritima sp. SCGC AAA799-A02]|nr:50S rRNA methyltransferase [Candidatus Nitromaritima sp. SCGC AAA799-C22]KMP12629.1 50S rRNA methyltransferase [Candidatus Nitromaritima sp. SCGC AAA799-A02]